jgi:hypothetical protein
VDPDFAAIPYRQRSPDYWPRSADPADRPHAPPEDTLPLPP